MTNEELIDKTDEFIEYIKEELRSRKLHKTKFYKAIKLPRNHDTI